VAAFAVASVAPPIFAAERTATLDPAGWGSDHVGKPIPEYITGDECLFCHRVSIGPAWAQNRHQSTLRQISLEPPALAALTNSAAHEPLAKMVEFVLGRTNQMRFLKRSDAYGKLDLLSTRFHPGAPGGAQLSVDPKPHWDTQTFANQCAGCHTTGVDARTKTFSAISIDCFSCHGDVTLEHTKDTTKVLLTKKRNEPARVAASICGSCHIRTGRSRSSGLPYPNNFVPGDNLFRDFEVDFSDEALAKLNPADRHIVQNVRDVVIQGREAVTCLSCHTVHSGSANRHRRLERGDLCWNCHERDRENLRPGWAKVHSVLCGY